MAYVLPQTRVIQDFTTAQGASAAPHSAVIIGESYELHRYSDPDEKQAMTGIAFEADTESVIPYQDLTLGNVPQTDSVTVYMEDALLEVGENLSVVDGTFVISGGSLTITALAGSFFTGATKPGSLNDRDVIPGDQLLLIDYSTPASTELVTVRTASEGVVTVTSPIDATWISGLTAGRFDIVVLYQDPLVKIERRRISNPAVANWTATTTDVTVHDTGITAVSSVAYNGTDDLPVHSGTIFVEYKARVTSLSSAPVAVSLDTLVASLGQITPENPLAYGAYITLQNSGLVQVYGISPKDDQLETWVDSLGRLDALNDAYILVPLTNDLVLQDVVNAHINVNSAGHTWRIGMVGMEVDQYTTKVDLDDSDTATVGAESGTVASIEHADANFIINGVVVGDLVKATRVLGGGQDDEITYHSIVAVISNIEIHALGVPTDFDDTGVTWTVVKQNTAADYVTQVVARAGHFSSRRIYLIWPDTIDVSGGAVVSGFYAACACAGLRSTSLPHQGLTNINLNGFTSVLRTTELFTGAQLNTMAEAGVWIITQELTTGEIYTRHQLSTDPTSLNTSEQNITTNIDDISYRVYEATYKLVGVGNVTPTMFRLINDTISYIFQGLELEVVNERLGPQLLEGIILSIAADPVFADKVVVKTSVDVPEALNQLEITITV